MSASLGGTLHMSMCVISACKSAIVSPYTSALWGTQNSPVLNLVHVLVVPIDESELPPHIRRVYQKEHGPHPSGSGGYNMIKNMMLNILQVYAGSKAKGKSTNQVYIEFIIKTTAITVQQCMGAGTYNHSHKSSVIEQFGEECIKPA